MSYRVAADETDLWMFDTVDEVADFVRSAYKPYLEPTTWVSRPLTARPAGLMERAVELAGPDGMTRQRLMTFVFRPMGKEKFENGCDMMLRRGQVIASTELLPNRKGGKSNQIVYRVPPIVPLAPPV